MIRFPESDYETSTGRQLYTKTAIREAYRRGIEDSINAAIEWAKSGGEYSLLDVLKDLEKETQVNKGSIFERFLHKR